jgi:PhzF family phenazine biosynthesis protein
MKLKLFQVDAFTDKVFSGNPAAICPLEEWLPDYILQQIAEENNLAETAFYVRKGEVFEIRWFTPMVEVDLCGHATLAAAFVLFWKEGYENDVIHFVSPRSGNLTVKKESGRLTLDFPADEYSRIDLTEDLLQCFNFKPVEAFRGKTDLMVVFRNEQEILALQPSFDKIERLGGRGVIVTARGDNADFVSRFFAPQVGIKEDPVTGSAHTTLTPYWAGELGKSTLSATQLSTRKGSLICTLKGDRVLISGKAALYLSGEIYI